MKMKSRIFFNILLFIFSPLNRESVICGLRSLGLHCLCKWFCLWLTAHSNGESGRMIIACLQLCCYLGKRAVSERLQLISRNNMDFSKYPQVDYFHVFSHCYVFKKVVLLFIGSQCRLSTAEAFCSLAALNIYTSRAPVLHQRAAGYYLEMCFA